MSRSLKFFLFGVASFFVFIACIIPKEHSLSQILEKLSAYTALRPQQTVYVHLDKPLYAAGEDIWFSAYLVDATFHKLDTLSKVVYVELFNEDKKLLKRHALYSPNGISHGDFHLADTLKAGNYVLRAYTNYMKNEGDDFFFSKEITVLDLGKPTQQNETTSSKLDVQFFPEGGNFLAGVENRIAFKAINQYGTSEAIEGEVVDENNAVVSVFKSEHQGMGVFKITPSFGKQYHARVKNAATVYNLPAVIQKGYLLKILDAGAFVKVIAYTDLKKHSKDPCKLYIVAQTRGVANFAAEGTILNTSLITNIPKSSLPTGITQITVFDGSGIPQCERLVFVNHQNTLHVSVKSNKENYAKRERVELNITVNTPGGKPAQGYFSMSVYDALKIEEKEKYPSSIATHFLLTADLKGKIEEPGYYFQDTLPKTKSHLDLLMMTQGWRRFTWETILNDTLKPIEYYAEKGIVVKGKALKLITNRPAQNFNIKFFTTTRDILILKTDSLGRFYNDDLVYYDSTNFFVQTENVNEKKRELNLQLDPFNISPSLYYTPSPLGLWNAQAFLDQAKIMNTISKNYKDGKVTLLKEVVVKDKKLETNSTRRFYGPADQTIKMKDLPAGYNDIIQALQGRVAGLNINGNSVSIRGGGEPLFLVDGVQLTFDMVRNISVNDVESIDILKGVSASAFGGRGANGVIAIYTKRGDGSSTRLTIGIYNFKYPGFYRAKEFYSPGYEFADDDKTIPDVRSTLYWNPAFETDHNGKARLSFYTSDVISQYKISMEGISSEGTPGVSTTHTIVVK